MYDIIARRCDNNPAHPQKILENLREIFGPPWPAPARLLDREQSVDDLEINRAGRGPTCVTCPQSPAERLVTRGWSVS
jgi:hypothetical protein